MNPQEYLHHWKETIVRIATCYRLDVSEQNISIIQAWNDKVHSGDKLIKAMAKQAGLSVEYVKPTNFKFNSWRLPIALETKDKRIAILKNISTDGKFEILFSDDHGLITITTESELRENLLRVVLLKPTKLNIEPRVDNYIKQREEHWVLKLIFKHRRPYFYLVIGSLFVNILGLAGTTFSMQTYDRIIPSQSFPTLIVLFIGVLIAFLFDITLRLLRYNIIDILGKNADLQISDIVYGHSLRVKSTNRPQSTGSFISQLRDLEQMREMITTSTVLALIDLPFFFFFLFIIWSIGGIVFIIPLLGLFLMVIPGLLCQRKLAFLSTQSMRESSLRNAMLVESIQGLDDIKFLQAEHRFQQQWLHYTSTTANCSLKLKHLTHNLTSWAYLVQNAVFVCVVAIGAPLVMEGDLSTGALVASSILSSRMMGPVSQFASILTRWQQTKVTLSGLDSILALSVDIPAGQKKVHKKYLNGDYSLQNLTMRHHVNSKSDALNIPLLNIAAGERIAILGRNGSGKSSLLSALAGNMMCVNGTITLDNISMANLAPSDLRRDVGYISQNSRLFYGTIRENLTLGAPDASSDMILHALEITGAINFVNSLVDGLEYLINEGGIGLSGGQIQSLLLSRMIIREPNIVLLDEPTASLDEETEIEFIQRIGPWLSERTVVIATHRKRVLDLVDRILILSNGKIIADESKMEISSRV